MCPPGEQKPSVFVGLEGLRVRARWRIQGLAFARYPLFRSFRVRPLFVRFFFKNRPPLPDISRLIEFPPKLELTEVMAGGDLIIQCFWFRVKLLCSRRACRLEGFMGTPKTTGEGCSLRVSHRVTLLSA